MHLGMKSRFGGISFWEIIKHKNGKFGKDACRTFLELRQINSGRILKMGSISIKQLNGLQCGLQWGLQWGEMGDNSLSDLGLFLNFVLYFRGFWGSYYSQMAN